MTNRGFTEAVPLSLSSMAHMSMTLEDGVLDGVKQVLQHTLLSCVNYARAIHAPHDWSFQDMGTTEHAWQAHEGGCGAALPPSLSKVGFKHQYHQTAFIYLKPAMKGKVTPTQEDELANVQDGKWADQKSILGRVSLLYGTTALMTKEELDGTEKDDDTPKCVLYNVLVEYRSLPATGKKVAVQAEELSMLSFGGSVDDDVKYGALASLYDVNAKYVLEIFSVRGKKYKFDLMDSTLSDGTVPRLPSRSGNDDPNDADPFVKSLCVTVTDHDTTKSLEKEYAITRIHLTMEGNLRTRPDEVPEPHFIAQKIQETFLSLNHAPPAMATAIPSGHTLLLDPTEAGKVYINGRYVTTWGNDPRIGSHCPALFGMDLHSIPYWHGRIFDYDMLKRNYAQMWQEILIDARLMGMNIGSRLLSRLINGRDPIKEEEDDDDSDLSLDDDDDDDDEQQQAPTKPHVNSNMDCLESQVMQSTKYDPVGISAKALATRFKMEYGEEGFPCLAHEIDWVKDRLPGRVPVAVSQRVINVLRRGGFFDAKRTSDEVWFSESRPAKDGTTEEEVVNTAVDLLKKAGCSDVTPNVIVFFSGEGITSPVQKKGLVRFNRSLRQYHVNEYFLHMDLVELQGESMSTDEEETKMDVPALAFLLGLHIAQEHPDGSVLLRYLLKHRNIS
jgi:hypothetical protein